MEFNQKKITAIVICQDGERERFLKYRNIKFSQNSFKRFIDFLNSRPYTIKAINLYDKESKKFMFQYKI